MTNLHEVFPNLRVVHLHHPRDSASPKAGVSVDVASKVPPGLPDESWSTEDIVVWLFREGIATHLSAETAEGLSKEVLIAMSKTLLLDGDEVPTMGWTKAEIQAWFYVGTVAEPEDLDGLTKSEMLELLE